jgi:hypothetical protein
MDPFPPQALGARVALMESQLLARVQRGILARPAWRINKENFCRIEKGMTMAQVQRLLGGPPGDYVAFGDIIGCDWSGLHICFTTCCFRWRGQYYENGVLVQADDEQWASGAGTLLLRFKRGKVTLRAFHSEKDGWLGDDELATDVD